MSTIVGREYSTVSKIAGPLLFIKAVKGVGYGEVAKITTPDGDERRGQVLEVGEDLLRRAEYSRNVLP